MKLRTSAVLVAPIAAFLATTAHAAPPPAAPKPIAMADQVGDGNALNDQTLFPLDPSPVPPGTKTDPAQVAAFDIKSLTIAATGSVVKAKVGRKMVKYFNCTGYTATLELSAAPVANGSLYRVQASTPLHETYWLEWSNEADGASTTTLRYTDEAATLGTSSIAIAPVKIDGSKIVFTVTNGNLKASGERAGKTILAGFGADVRTNGKVKGSGATAPMWDQLTTDGSQTWKVCPA